MRREGISLRCYIRKGGGVGWIGKERRLRKKERTIQQVKETNENAIRATYRTS